MTAEDQAPADRARLVARGRALRTVAEYQPGSASQMESPFEAGMARTRLNAFLAKHGLTHADLDQDSRFLTTWSGGDGWTAPEPRVPHVVHRMDGFTSSGTKWRAWCRCGHGTTARVTRDRALGALRTDPAHPLEPTVCCLCGKDYTKVTGDGWMDGRDRLVVLTDSYTGEFMVCRDDCGLDRQRGAAPASSTEKTPAPGDRPGRLLSVAELVPMLVRERFPADLGAAVLGDEIGVPALLVVCEGIDGGEAAMISVVFRGLAARLAGQPSEMADILHSATPAAVFAAKVRAQFTSWISD